MGKQIFITDFDMKRFRWLLNHLKSDVLYKKALMDLEKELENAVIVYPKEIPTDVVTMHTRFRIKDLNTNQDYEYTLVFPFDADIEQKKLSILTPIGIAVIGYRKGDVIEWDNSGGKKNLRIEEILYQPEAQGFYYI